MVLDSNFNSYSAYNNLNTMYSNGNRGYPIDGNCTSTASASAMSNSAPVNCCVNHFDAGPKMHQTHFWNGSMMHHQAEPNSTQNQWQFNDCGSKLYHVNAQAFPNIATPPFSQSQHSQFHMPNTSFHHAPSTGKCKISNTKQCLAKCTVCSVCALKQFKWPFAANDFLCEIATLLDYIPKLSSQLTKA